MRLAPDPTGRFARRPFYEKVELDTACESLVDEFLLSLYGKVQYPISTNDITKLIERHVEDLDLYADLPSLYGDGVEGVTEFQPDGKPTVRITAMLAEDERRENRLRTTLTHEFGHVHFHSWLFDVQGHTGQLFPGESRQKAAQVCKRETILDAPMVDWMEWQAGHISGALLMPATAIRLEASQVLASISPPDFQAVRAPDRFGLALIDAVASRFLVSKEAARVRLLRLAILQE